MEDTNHQNQSLESSYLALIEFLMLSKRQIIEHGNHYGLTSMQALTLLLLDDPRPMNSFTKVFSCDASNITGLIDNLEEKELAKRYEHPNDRRIKMVELSSRGIKVRKDLLSELTGPHGYILEKLNDKEVGQFIKLIEKITS